MILAITNLNKHDLTNKQSFNDSRLLNLELIIHNTQPKRNKKFFRHSNKTHFENSVLAIENMHMKTSLREFVSRTEFMCMSTDLELDTLN